MKKLIALLLLSPLAFAVEIQANDSLVDKCRLTYPDSKDVDRFLGCIQGDKPAELSDYHRSQIPDLKTSDYETRKIEDICTDTQLIDSVRNIYLIKLKAGDVYRGQLNAKCQFDGEGTYMYGNGTEFVGTYANNKRVSGSESYPDGGVRDGMSFIDNQLHGTTKFYFVSGQVNQETWRNGKNIGNVMIKASPQVYGQSQGAPRNNAPRPDPWKVIGDEVNKMIERNDSPFYGNKKTAVCNFKSNRGAIISGDCNEINIRIGDTLYWKD